MFNTLNADKKDFHKVVNDILLEVKPMRLRGSISDKFLGYCNELRQKIADLEAKLAESENRVKDLEFRNKNLEHSLSVAPNANAGQRARIVELKGINHQLKQQLAEKDLKIIELETKLNLKDKETNV